MCTLCGPDESVAGPRVSRRTMLAALGGAAALLGTAGCAGAATASDSTAPDAVSPETGVGPAERAPFELVLLGTKAGPPIDPLRVGISTALVVDGATYVIDCGRSAATQYVRSGLTLDSLAGIFITHLHADHIADYYNFFLLGGSVPNQEGDSLAGPVPVYGPGPAGGLPLKFGGGDAATVNPGDPTPGIAALTAQCHDAYAYNTNVFLRDMGIRDIRTLTDVHEIAVPDVGASFENTAPTMEPFVVMEDERVKVTAILVPHGPVFPSFAFRFDTRHGSVTFSGDTTYTDNLVELAKGSDVLVHEAISVEGFAAPEVFLDHLLQSHVEVQKVGPIAQRVGASKLVLTHISDLAGNPLDADKWKMWAQAGFDGEVVVGDDLQRIRLA